MVLLNSNVCVLHFSSNLSDFSVFLSIMGIEPKASHMIDKHSAESLALSCLYFEVVSYIVSPG